MAVLNFRISQEGTQWVVATTCVEGIQRLHNSTKPITVSQVIMHKLFNI